MPCRRFSPWPARVHSVAARRLNVEHTTHLPSAQRPSKHALRARCFLQDEYRYTLTEAHGRTTLLTQAEAMNVRRWR